MGFGIPGNEEGDRLKKLGTRKVPAGPEPTVIVNKKVIPSLKSAVSIPINNPAFLGRLEEEESAEHV